MIMKENPDSREMEEVLKKAEVLVEARIGSDFAKKRGGWQYFLRYN